MLDPQVQALLTMLESADGVPLVRGSAADTPQHYRELAMGYFRTAKEIVWFFRQYASGGPADGSLDLLGADVTGVAPAVVATAEFDPLRDEGDAYAERLRAAAVPVVHLRGPGLVHGYFGFLGLAEAADRQSAAVLAAFDALLDGRTPA